MSSARGTAEPGPWEKELDDLLRALSGAFLFGVPLLFTMEMWWLGTYLEPWRLLAFLALAWVGNLHLAYIAGFKQKTTFGSVVDQAVDALAVGAIGALVVLFALNRVRPTDPLQSIVGMVALQAVPLSLGASAANAAFSVRGETGEEQKEKQAHSPWSALLHALGATVGVGVFIGFSVAPTEEVPMLAAGINSWHQLILIALSLVITYMIVFESGFSPQRPRRRQEGAFHEPLAETAMAYLASLLVAFISLYLFGQFTLGDPPSWILAQTFVLGLPIAIGGAAGRLLHSMII